MLRRQLDFDNYPLLIARPPLLDCLSVEPQDRLHRHTAAAARRLSDRLRHGARAPLAAPDPPDAGDPAVLDLFLIRVYAWIGILKPDGLLNQLLLRLGLIASRWRSSTPTWAVYIGIVYSYLPFMVLPLYAALEKLDQTLLEAAADLGCPPTRPSGRSPFRFRCPASSPARCWSSSRRSASSSSPTFSAAPDADDRQDALGRVLPQSRLAGRLRRRDRPAPRPGGADRALPELAGARREAGDETPPPPSTSSRSRSASPSSTCRSCCW